MKDDDNCTTYTVPDDNIMPELRNLPVFPAEDFVIFPTGMNLLQVHDKKQIEAARRAMRESSSSRIKAGNPCRIRSSFRRRKSVCSGLVAAEAAAALTGVCRMMTSARSTLSVRMYIGFMWFLLSCCGVSKQFFYVNIITERAVTVH